MTDKHELSFPELENLHQQEIQRLHHQRAVTIKLRNAYMMSEAEETRIAGSINELELDLFLAKKPGGFQTQEEMRALVKLKQYLKQRREDELDHSNLPTGQRFGLELTEQLDE